MTVSTPATAAAPIFSPQSYYGELSRTRADQLLFGRLTKRFRGQYYKVVRRKLAALGYRPKPLRRLPEEEDNTCFWPHARYAYREIIACSSMGDDARAFAFLRPHGRGDAVVVTYGEDNETLKVGNIRAASETDMYFIKLHAGTKRGH